LIAIYHQWPNKSCKCSTLCFSDIAGFDYLLLDIFVKYFATNVVTKIEIEISTIVPLGAELSI